MGFDLTTFLFETVNFVVLVLILQRLVCRPLRRAIDERRGSVLEEQERLAKRMQGVEKLEAEYQARTRDLEQLRQDKLREASAQAAEERARLLERAQEDAAAERARVQRMLSAEREAAVAWVREMAVDHSTEGAGRFLMSLAPDLIDGVLLEQILREIDRRGGDLRGDRPGRNGGSTTEVELTFARPPRDEDVARLRERLVAAFGTSLDLVIRDDVSLGAGLVVRAGGRVLDASVAGQLDAFRERVREQIEPEARVV